MAAGLREATDVKELEVVPAKLAVKVKLVLLATL